MKSPRYRGLFLAAGLLVQFAGSPATRAEDRPQWGSSGSRNMVSAETGLPDRFDPATGKNIKWTAQIGSQCWSSPVIGGGKVLIGTNNGQPRDPRHDGDRGVMMCFDEADGRFAWQLIVPKLEEDVYHDWPRAGMCSPATIEGDRVYTVTNRDEVVCLDLHGMANGNDGPFRDEGRHMTPRDQPAMKVGPLDADIIWLLDLRAAVGVRPHDSVHCSVLVVGQYLYINTNNGLNSRHSGVEKPNAPSLVVVDKITGKLIAKDNEGIGPKIFHSTWSSPAFGEVGPRRLVFFGGGDGVVYALDALRPRGNVDSQQRPVDIPQSPRILERTWRFDCDPTAPKEDVHSYIRNRRVSPSNIKSMPVFLDNRVYVTFGGDIWWGKEKAWLTCIDATKTGDITQSGRLWTYPLERHCCSTPSVSKGLVYVADCGGKVHCVDAKTGRVCWVHDAEGEMWASTLVADDKVYIGTRRGDFWVLAAGREKRVLSSIRLDTSVICTAAAANGTLYVGTMTQIFALKK